MNYNSIMAMPPDEFLKDSKNVLQKQRSPPKRLRALKSRNIMFMDFRVYVTCWDAALQLQQESNEAE